MLRGELRPDPTPAELRVLRLYASGLTVGQVAKRLGIHPFTVRKHTSSAYQRLGVAGVGRGHPANATLLRALNKLGWVQVPSSPEGT